jgi:hypothetical protein
MKQDGDYQYQSQAAERERNQLHKGFSVLDEPQLNHRPAEKQRGDN